MPYIKKEDRAIFDTSINNMLNVFEHFEPNQISGICNYIITRLLDGAYQEDRYDKINSAIGVLECAKLEFYRRRAADYEDTKIAENGDAYGLVRLVSPTFVGTPVAPTNTRVAKRTVSYNYSGSMVYADIEYHDIETGRYVDSFQAHDVSVSQLEEYIDATYPITITHNFV